LFSRQQLPTKLKQTGDNDMVATQKQSDPPSDVLTLVEAAKYLKISERSLWELAKAKKLPAVQLGSLWRFTRKSLDEWFQQQSQTGKE
jgi:excisionase family DNA binding protein